MQKRYRVTLTEEERTRLHDLLSSGKAAARTLPHARILLKADQGPEGPGWSDEAIRDALYVGLSTIGRVRERFIAEGLEAALYRRPSPRHRHRQLDGQQEAHLVALTCSAPPAGQARWTLRVLADTMVELAYVERVSYETIRQTLKKTRSSRG